MELDLVKKTPRQLIAGDSGSSSIITGPRPALSDGGAKWALTHFCWRRSLRCTDQSGLQQIEFGSPIHLAFDKLQSCDLTFRLSVRPR